MSWKSTRGMIYFFALVVASAAAGCGDDVSTAEEDSVVSTEIAPRGVAALGGDGFNFIRYAPAPWAQVHRIEGSSREDFSDVEEIATGNSGHFVHPELTNGQTWYYRVIAISAEGEERTSSVVDATPSGADLLSIYVEMDPDELSELYERDPHSRDRLPATVFVGAPDGPEVDVEGLRFRGSTTRTYDKIGFNIRLEDRPELDAFPEFNFRSEERRTGNRLALNAMWTDPTAMREALSFAMYDELDLVAPTTYFTDLYFNGIFEGLYIGLERVDREALRRWGLNRSRGGFTMVRDESKSYRHELEEVSRRSIFGANIDAAVDSDEEAIEIFKEIFRYRGETEDQNWEGLLELVRWAYQTPAGATYQAEFEERFDVDAFIDFLAIHVLTHDRDSLDIDYWLYRDDEAVDGRWVLIPWDKNLTFGAHYYGGVQGTNDFFEYDRDMVPSMGNALVDKFFATPGLNEQFEKRLSELASEVFDDDWFEEKMNGYAAEIAPSMARAADSDAYEVHPGQHHGKLGWWMEHRQALLDFVDLRRSWVLNQLGENEESTDERVRIFDDEGRIVADFYADGGGFDGDISIEVVEDVDHDRVGIDRGWKLEVSEPVSGELTLYWKNTPHESWYREEVNPGTQWYLDAHIKRDDDDWKRFPAQVLPFSNKLTVSVELDGTTRLEIGY